MNKIIYKNGSLLEATEEYIAHQCNCVSTSGGGLAYHMFITFPFADIYSTKDPNHRYTLGTNIVKGNGTSERYVINMFGQFYPGGPLHKSSKTDGSVAREVAFAKCLSEIKKIPNIKSVAFPIRIGCGLAGGNWNNYLKMIEAFAEDGKIITSIYIPENL